MANKSRLLTVLMVELFVFCLFGVVPAGIGSGKLISSELLSHGKLKVVWENQLPLKNGESLKELFLVGSRIYALSDRNYLVSLNKEKGNMVFGSYVAEYGFPLVGLELYEGELFSIIGGKVAEIDPDVGVVEVSERFKYGVVCPAGRNSSYYYVVGSDNRLHAVRSEDKIEAFEAAASNDSAITSLVVDEDLVVFGTEAGNLIRIMPDKPKERWRFDAAEGIVGEIVKDGKWLFVSSKDTNVYKVNARTGKLGWKYQTEASLNKGPRVTGDVVYQYVLNKGLAAIDKSSGERIWELAGGLDLLAEGDGKAYVLSSDGKLVVMDNVEKKQLYSVNFSNVSRYVANVEDSRIYIADEQGLVLCLESVE